MSQILVIKTNMMIRPETLEKVRQDAVKQYENGGVIILPNGFYYELVEADKLACDIEVIPLE